MTKQTALKVHFAVTFMDMGQQARKLYFLHVHSKLWRLRNNTF